MTKSPPNGMFARGWRSLRSAGPKRLGLTGVLLILAVALARFSWLLPAVGDAERALYDLRTFTLAPQVAQDPRIVLAVYNDQTLINTRKRSPLDRGVLARALANLDRLGARAIAIDILFDQPQDEDARLLATLRGMKTPTRIGYAETHHNAGNITYEQQMFLEGFLAKLRGSRAQSASIRLDDAYGVTRVWPEPKPGLPPSLAGSLVGKPDYRGSIRFRLPADDSQPVFASIPIDQLADPHVAPLMAPLFAGRYVLIGGDIVDTDRVSTPLSAATGTLPPGIEVHAAMLAQMLDKAPAIPPALWLAWAEAILVVVAAALTGLVEMKSWKFLPFFGAQILLFGGLPFYLQGNGIDTYRLPAIGLALGWLLAFIAVVLAARASGSVERRFAQSALGKYLPRSIAAEIIERPELLALHGEKKDIYVLFSDLEGFTELSHQLEPETVASLLNRYLEGLSQVVLNHGGVIDKFVGDAVVAFWGAPIALPDDGERAGRAAYALWQSGEEFRASVPRALPPVGRTRVGLHFGAAVVGNFGGESRIQYTALGDAMNTASRLESANKTLETRVLASAEFVARSPLDWWRPMGRIGLRGRAQPVDVFDAAPGFPSEQRAALAHALSLIRNDRQESIRLLAEIARNNPTDRALQKLLDRTEKLTEDGTYVLS